MLLNHRYADLYQCIQRNCSSLSPQRACFLSISVVFVRKDYEVEFTSYSALYWWSFEGRRGSASLHIQRKRELAKEDIYLTQPQGAGHAFKILRSSC
jgi:hypothetical protein